jgi:hypothetical protein
MRSSWKANSCPATEEILIEPEGSLLCSQEPATDPYPEPD